MNSTGRDTSFDASRPIVLDRRLMAKDERSAGLIIFREDPDGRRLYLLLDYGKHWDYPKGHIEKGEDEVAAAPRELKEETGIEDAKLIEGFRDPIVYFFRGISKELIRKEVVFLLAETQTKDVKLSHEHV